MQDLIVLLLKYAANSGNKFLRKEDLRTMVCNQVAISIHVTHYVSYLWFLFWQNVVSVPSPDDEDVEKVVSISFVMQQIRDSANLSKAAAVLVALLNVAPQVNTTVRHYKPNENFFDVLLLLPTDFPAGFHSTA